MNGGGDLDQITKETVIASMLWYYNAARYKETVIALAGAHPNGRPCGRANEKLGPSGATANTAQGQESWNFSTAVQYRTAGPTLILIIILLLICKAHVQMDEERKIMQVQPFQQIEEQRSLNKTPYANSDRSLLQLTLASTRIPTPTLGSTPTPIADTKRYIFVLPVQEVY